MFQNEQNKLGCCHRNGMAEVAKLINMASAVHQGLQGSYFSIRSSFKTQKISSTRSATVLT